MSTLPDFDADDTGRIESAARERGSDPARDIAALRARAIAHESADRVRFAILAALATLMLSGVAYYAQQAQAEAAEAASTRAQLTAIDARLGRIEAQIDRLVERDSRP